MERMQARRRVVSVWLPEFATDRLARRREAGGPPPFPLATPRATPLATVAQIRGSHRLAAVNGAARRGGLAPGLPLADARALLPALETFHANSENDFKALENIALWAWRYSPSTAVDGTAPPANHGASFGPDCGPDYGLWLDISGCGHLFGGEAQLAADLISRLGQAGYRAQAGLAGTPGAAWAVARFRADDDTPVRVVPPGGERDALAPLSIRALRLEDAPARLLERLGLARIGDLYPLARSALAQRAGLGPAMRLDQALGERDEPISPIAPPPVLQVRLKFPDPIGLADDIEAALDRLLPALCGRLERAGIGARRLDFTLYRIDGTVSRVTAGTGRPERDPDHLKRLFREKLDALDPGFGVETALLATRTAEPMAAEQQSAGDAGAGQDTAALGWLIDRLANRLGPRAVTAIAPRESHLPERAETRRPLVRDAAPAGAPVNRNTDADAAAAPGIAGRAPRPLYLLPMPEPVDTLTLTTGDRTNGPPGATGGPRSNLDRGAPPVTPMAFRWRGRQHTIRRADGPERIEPEWWRSLVSQGPGNEDRPEGSAATPDIPGNRDYYAVEDDRGERFWLYRQNGPDHAAPAGALRPGAPPAPGRAPKWFLHGLFS
ncbi:MAG: DNA polymerase Y family protein [Rhodospirillaceae bacterium]